MTSGLTQVSPRHDPSMNPKVQPRKLLHRMSLPCRCDRGSRALSHAPRNPRNRTSSPASRITIIQTGKSPQSIEKSRRSPGKKFARLEGAEAAVLELRSTPCVAAERGGVERRGGASGGLQWGCWGRWCGTRTRLRRW